MSGQVTEAILKEICPERKRRDSLSVPGPTFVLCILLIVFSDKSFDGFCCF